MRERKPEPMIQEMVDIYGNWFQGGCENARGNAARMTRELYPYTSISPQFR